MARTGTDSYDVKLNDEQKTQLANFLHDEITRAVSARATIIEPGGDLDYWHALYNISKRNSRELPFPGAADLGTWIISEKVDATRARFVKTIFVDPVWTVEGWGAAAERAPLVEEFHQWKVEDERLQSILQRVFELALIEGTGVLECSEAIDMIKQRSTLLVKPRTAEDGTLLLDKDGQPELERDERGQLVEATDPDVEGAVETEVDTYKLVGTGPQYRVISLRDFLVLPGHAQDRSEVWGYAKRFWRRMPELERRATQGIYDPAAVARLAQVSDRESQPLAAPVALTGQQIAPQDRRDTIEKELWEVQLRSDLDGDGAEEWYVVTFSVIHRECLRVKYDDLNLPRFHLFAPKPNPLSVYGRSLVDKLSSLGEEHMGVRNATADRSNLINNAPIKRLASSPWDPDEEPWGPGAVITVNDPNDVQPVSIPDVPASMLQREDRLVAAAERMSGLNDVSLGATPDQSRTLGEVQMVTEQSFVRIEEDIKNIQETLEDLFAVRHELWRRAAAQAPLEPSEKMIEELALRGIDLAEGGITPELLAGKFHGKPRGNVESADINRQRNNYNGFMAVVGGFAKMNPSLAPVIGSPDVLIPLFEQALRLYQVPNRAQFMRALKGWQQQLMQQQLMQQHMQAMMPPGAPGMPPPGMPPGPPGMPPPGAPMPGPMMPPMMPGPPMGGGPMMPPGGPPGLM